VTTDEAEVSSHFWWSAKRDASECDWCNTLGVRTGG